jgi:hypothetical protein
MVEQNRKPGQEESVDKIAIENMIWQRVVLAIKPYIKDQEVKDAKKNPKAFILGMDSQTRAGIYDIIAEIAKNCTPEVEDTINRQLSDNTKAYNQLDSYRQGIKVEENMPHHSEPDLKNIVRASWYNMGKIISESRKINPQKT